MLKDKIYQLYNEYYENLSLNYINNKESIEKLLNYEIHTDSEYTVAEMAESLLKTYFVFGEWLLSFCKLVPGLDKLSDNDLSNLIHDRISLLLNIHFSSFYFNDQIYFLLHDSKRLCRKWQNILGGQGCFESRYKFKKLQFKQKRVSTFISSSYQYIR